MKTLIDLIAENVKDAFVSAGYDEKYAKVTLSNRPDLCEYQCNGAMAAAKKKKKAPIMIAGEVLEHIKEKEMFSSIEAVMPGFINFSISSSYLAGYINEMNEDVLLGCNKVDNPKTIVIDYGGANVAKPLHVKWLEMFTLATGGFKWDSLSLNFRKESRIWSILMRIMTTNIHPRHHLPSAS